MTAATLRYGLAVACLCLATLAVLQVPWRFELRGDSLSIEPPESVPQIWLVSPEGVSTAAESDGGGLLLDADRSRGVPYVAAVVRRAKPFSHLRIALDLKIEGLRPGRQDWQEVGLILTSFSEGFRTIGYWPKRVLGLDRDQDWGERSRVFPLHDGTRAIRVLAYNAAASGRLWLRRIELVPLYERDLFVGLRYLVIALWAAFFGFCAWSLLRLEGRKAPRAGLILLFALATAAIVMPQPHYGRIVFFIEGVADTLFERPEPPPGIEAEAPEDEEQPAEPEPTPDAGAEPEAEPGTDEAPGEAAEAGGEAPAQAQDRTRKGRELHFLGRLGQGDGPLDWIGFKELAHFSMFLLLALVSLLTFRRRQMTPIFAFLLCYAVASEFLQLFVATRSTNPADFLVNALGISVGGLIFLALRRALPSGPGIH